MGCGSSTPIAPSGVVPGGGPGAGAFAKPTVQRAAPGAALLAAAVGSPPLSRVALSLATAVHVCQKSRALKDDAHAFAAIARSLEICLCSPTILAAPALDGLDDVLNALDDVVAYIKALQGDEALATATSLAVAAPQLRLSRDAIAGGVRAAWPESGEQCDSWMSVDFEDEADAHELLRSKGGAAAVLADPASKAQLSGILGLSDARAASMSKKRAAAMIDAMNKEADAHEEVLVANRQQQAVILKRNELLKEQVSQMTTMLSSQHMRLKQFMERFPISASEAERRLVFSQLNLHKLTSNIPAAEACMDEFFSRSPVKAALGAILFNVVGEQVNYYFCGRSTDGPGSSTILKLPTVLRMPRKCTPCQYVAAAGGVVCSDRATSRVMMSDWLKPLLADAVGLDKEASEAFHGLMSAKEMAVAAEVFAGRLTVEQGSDRVSAEGLHEGLYRWILRSAGPDHLADRVAYYGIPMHMGGEDIGVCCSFFKLPDGVDAADFDAEAVARRIRLHATVSKMSAILEEYAKENLMS